MNEIQKVGERTQEKKKVDFVRTKERGYFGVSERE